MNPQKMSPRVWKWLVGVAFCAIVFAEAVAAASAADRGAESAQGFVSPPDSAKPQTWWHWMNGNITKEGITADLEAMQRVGIGGAEIFNVLEGIPDGPIDYLSPQWKELFRHAATEADRLGLKLCVMNGAGWSNSGGPWITPEHAMQTVVTSETKVKGPAHFDAALPQPPTKLGYYRDIAVLAFPTPLKDARVGNLDVKALKHDQYEYDLMPDAKKPPAAAVIPRQDRRVDFEAERRRQIDVGRARRRLDDPAGGPHADRHGKPSGAKPGRGLECDKLARGPRRPLGRRMQPLLDYLGPLAGKTLNGCLIDSYEVGDDNWSPKFREEFRKRRGYDPVPFLPTLTGCYVVAAK